MFVVCKVVRKTRFVRAEEMDLVTGLEEVEKHCWEEPPPKNRMERFWSWLM
ncbi:hypothetical protein VNI00_008228 [Paramarasmius palmivorus]|uniref:Uncharacterized protein n=1 Tax=Paramarasmius palmivorus TaxID=297713 RepID=A0AAW0CYK5_9AGAR